MPNQWPSPITITGGHDATGSYVDHTTAQPVGIPIFSSPILATTAEYILEQEFQQARSSFTPTALNTAHPSAGLTPDYSSYVLVAELPRKDIGGGLVKWVRRYAQVPAPYDDFRSVNYNFIAWLGAIAMGSFWNFANVQKVVVTGRPRINRRVSCRVHNDFFLVGTGGSFSGAGNIPPVYQQRYTFPAFATQPIDSDWITDTLAGGISATTPSRTTYEGWMTNAQSLGWASGIAPSGSLPGQIVSDDSILTRWEGNIWHMETFYVLAQ